MGWASGSSLAIELWDDIRCHIASGQDRREVSRKFIKHFQDHDCDTMGECEQLVNDAEMQDEFWSE
jgi:hypothetical protein